jgi:serine/threonine protein kinase
MEYVSGTDLSRLLKEKGMLPVAEACNFVHQAARGLEHVHQNNMVHRDLKPGNLMVTDEYQIKILDLGLALLSEAPVAFGGEITESGQVLGTLDYMAPEQCYETHTVDIRADIYSLGATLFALITGQPPFPSHQYPSLLQKLNAIAHASAPAISKFRSDVPRELAAIISRMLANNPVDRIQTPEEVVRSLLPFCSYAEEHVAIAVRDQTATIPSELLSSYTETVSPGDVSKRLFRGAFSRVAAPVAATIVLAAIAVFSVSGLLRTTNNASRSNAPDHLPDAQSLQQPITLEQQSSKRNFRSQRELAEYVISLGGSVFTCDVAGRSDWRLKVADLNNDSPVVMGVRFPRGTDVTVAELEPVLQAPSLRMFEIMFHQGLTREHLSCLREQLKPDELHTLILGTLSDSAITDEDVAALLDRLPRLRGLCLMHLSLDGSFIDSIVHPENVDGLTVTSPDQSILVSRPTTVTVRFMETLKTFPALETFELTNGKLTTDHYRLLAGFQSLKTCRLINTAAVAENLESIISLPRLESLNLMGTSLTDAHVATLSKASRLTLLDLRNNGISKEAMDRLRVELPGCVIESDFGRLEPTGTESSTAKSPQTLRGIQASPERHDEGSETRSSPNSSP